MRVLLLLGVLALLHLRVGAEICEMYAQSGCKPHDLVVGLDAPNKDVHAAAPPPRPPPPSRPPPAQGANEELWAKLKNKGCTLAWAMHASDHDPGSAYNPLRNTAKSPYQQQSDLKKWGWHKFPRDKVNPNFHDFYNVWGIGWALQGLGVSPYSDGYEGGKNEIFAIDHADPTIDDVDNQWYEAEGRWYRATGASYGFSINWEEGAVMGLNRHSPKHAGRERNPPVRDDELPGLNQFSDVAWIGWESVVRANRGDIQNLRFLVAVGITNEETKSAIVRAMNAKSWRLGPWPGSTFDMEGQEARALLGTPNLQGFVYFLVQHKEQLGNMFVKSLQVFHGETEHRNPCVVMHLSKAATEVGRRDGRKDVVRLHTLRANL